MSDFLGNVGLSGEAIFGAYSAAQRIEPSAYWSWVVPQSEIVQFSQGAIFLFGGEGSGEDGAASPQFIRGRVVDIEGNGASRTVIAVERSSGRSVGFTTSAADGWFTLRPRSLEPCILVAVPLDGEQINAVVLDNILPVPD